MDGLSLCIQGTQMPKERANITKRFIPVYTGNTLEFFLKLTLSPVYPCVYREHRKRPIKRKTVCGLSLCIQGTQNLI